MLLIVLGIFLALAVACAVIDMKNRKEHYYNMLESGWTFLGVVFLVIALILLCIICFKAYDVIPEANIIDKKIAMYEEENARIEATIQDMVSGYIEYESDVIDKVLNSENGEENAIALVSLFPELNSNTLVQKQLDIYLSNNEKIKELKAKKIELSMQKFVLYFGN